MVKYRQSHQINRGTIVIYKYINVIYDLNIIYILNNLKNQSINLFFEIILLHSFETISFVMKLIREIFYHLLFSENVLRLHLIKFHF